MAGVVESLEQSAESVVGRVTVLLDAFDARSRELGVSELARRCSLPKSTVDRLARELAEHVPGRGGAPTA